MAEREEGTHPVGELQPQWRLVHLLETAMALVQQGPLSEQQLLLQHDRVVTKQMTFTLSLLGHQQGLTEKLTEISITVNAA